MHSPEAGTHIVAKPVPGLDLINFAVIDKFAEVLSLATWSFLYTERYDDGV